jgi:hypothetical protein
LVNDRAVPPRTISVSSIARRLQQEIVKVFTSIPPGNLLLPHLMSTTPTLAQWQRGLQIAEQIAALEKELASILGHHSAPVAKAAPAQADRRKGKTAPAQAQAPVKKKGKMSAQGLANIKAAQKKRWAKIKAAKKAPAAAKATAPAKAQAKAPAPVKKKPAMSAEAKAKLSAMMKARWEAKKAATAPAATEAPAEAPAAPETATE